MSLLAVAFSRRRRGKDRIRALVFRVYSDQHAEKAHKVYRSFNVSKAIAGGTGNDYSMGRLWICLFCFACLLLISSRLRATTAANKKFRV